MNDSALLDVAAVADRLGVSRRTVERMATDGAIPSVRISDRIIRFDPADVAAFIASRKTEPTS